MKVYQFYIIFFSVMVSLLDARPYGERLSQSESIDFDQRWNNNLEEQEKHPFIALQQPYWESHKKQHMEKLNIHEQASIDPFRFMDRSIKLNLLYLDASRMDQVMAYKDVNTYNKGSIRFKTRGPAFELQGRAKALHYNWVASYLNFSVNHEIAGEETTRGYWLSFGDKVGDYQGVAETDMSLWTLGQEKVFDSRPHSKFSMLFGISGLSLSRMERFRGNDRNKNLNGGVNSTTGARVIVEQGQEDMEQSGAGVFAGIRYLSNLQYNFNWLAKVQFHAMNLDQNQTVETIRISEDYLKETNLRSMGESSTEAVIDLELVLQKYYRDFYNLSLGFRYIHVPGDFKDSLSSQSRSGVDMRGIQLSFQRFF